MAQTLEHKLIVRQLDSGDYQLQILDKAIQNMFTEKESFKQLYDHKKSTSIYEVRQSCSLDVSKDS